MRAGTFSILSFQSAALLAATAIGRRPECYIRETENQPAEFQCAEFQSSPERTRDRSPPVEAIRSGPEHISPKTTFPPLRAGRPVSACPPERPRHGTRPVRVFAIDE